MRDDLSRYSALSPPAGTDAGLPAVRLAQLWKTYPGGKQPAVSDLSLDVAKGEMVTLLGPNGCGKSTTLRLVAGLEVPDRGEIFFAGSPVASAEEGLFVPPDKRNVGMVFQHDFGVWPHMSVEENVAFPLKARRYPRNEIGEKVQWALDLVGLWGLQKDRSQRLSVEQQQRLALARAVVTRPHVLLLDEPFTNLAAALREQLGAQVRALQKHLAMTVLFVTHDQREALALSDRIVLMKNGSVYRQGSPELMYQEYINAVMSETPST